MAKMFYSLEEAAQRLGVSVEEIKRLASTGKLQQFRDREKLMYKRDQVDAMASEVGTTGIANVVDSDDSGPLDLVGGEDQVDLAEAKPSPKERKEDPRQKTGISVFDAGEVEAADPMAQTQVTKAASDDEALVLESVGSGSGLLDLTRESDDTSLGAELLEEIYPGSGEGSDAKLEPVPGSSSGLANIQVTPESGASGLENLQPSSGAAAMAGAEPTAMMPMSYAAPDAYDPAGSGMGAGALIGALVCLILVLVIAISGVQGVTDQVTVLLSSNLWMYVGLLAAVTLIAAVVGLFVGKSMARV